mmetsp:Transcript_60803/g.107970  ORF Transcript_60803/g.107970 Transcript_60803/m.107970 type:complete len:145 (+) Transcript_60803:50-484(+)
MMSQMHIFLILLHVGTGRSAPCWKDGNYSIEDGNCSICWKDRNYSIAVTKLVPLEDLTKADLPGLECNGSQACTYVATAEDLSEIKARNMTQFYTEPYIANGTALRRLVPVPRLTGIQQLSGGNDGVFICLEVNPLSCTVGFRS